MLESMISGENTHSGLGSQCGYLWKNGRSGYGKEKTKAHGCAWKSKGLTI